MESSISSFEEDVIIEEGLKRSLDELVESEISNSLAELLQSFLDNPLNERVEETSGNSLDESAARFACNLVVTGIETKIELTWTPQTVSFDKNNMTSNIIVTKVRHRLQSTLKHKREFIEGS
jgi:hypothetical protein